MTVNFSRKVQTTRDEFLRQLPDAVGEWPCRVEGDGVIIGKENQSVRLKLTDLGIEDKGSLHLPMQQVDFNFENMTVDDVQKFMTHWDEHELRMGG